VLKRMTVGAKNLKVFEGVVVPVSVFVMDAKNVGVFSVTAPLTFSKHPTSFHCLSDGCKRRDPFALCGLIDAHSAAILPVVRWRATEGLFAVLACIFNAALLPLRFCVALSRTVFGRIAAGRDVRKVVPALGAFGAYLRSLGKRATPAGAKLERIPSVFGDVDFSSAVAARQHFVGNA